MHELLKEKLKSLKFWKNHELIWLTSTTSTNDDLKEIWRKPDFSHKIEIADLQTKGKGQYERKWVSSNTGQCLMFSFSLDIEEYKFPISLIAGIALAQALEKLSVSPKDYWLKWPNDIWINDKKLSGILTESTTLKNGFRCIVGIGINILPLSDKNVNSISLKEAGVSVSREAVLLEFCKAWDFCFSLSDLEQAKLWNKYGNQFWERKVKVQIPNSSAFIAKPISVAKDGSLTIQTSDGKQQKIISATLLPII